METVVNFIGLNLEVDSELKEIVELACAICKTPIAFITFLDDDTQYFKVKIGLDITTRPRTESFCTYTLEHHDDIMIVPDTRKDERFAENSAVTGNPGVRFYAGVPLTTTGGQRVGTLCVAAFKKGRLDDKQQHMLKIIAKQAMKTIELKLRTLTLEKSLKEVEGQQEFINNASIRLRSFFESSTNFQVLLGKSGEVIDYNKTAYNFVKKAHKIKLKRGDLFVSYIAPEFVSTFIDRYHLALMGERRVEEGSTDYGELGKIWWDATFEPARNENDEIIGVSYLIRNITERMVKEQKILAQNQSLLNVAHIQAHEFRGPLSTIMGLMNLIKAENYDVPVSYFKYLEEAINTLDSKIKNIVMDIEKNVVE